MVGKMAVAELIEHLKQFNPEHQVWMASDDEGNEYRPLGEVANFETFEVEHFDDEYEDEVYIRLEQFSYNDVCDNPNVVMIWPGYYVQN